MLSRTFREKLSFHSQDKSWVRHGWGQGFGKASAWAEPPEPSSEAVFAPLHRWWLVLAVYSLRDVGRRVPSSVSALGRSGSTGGDPGPALAPAIQAFGASSPEPRAKWPLGAEIPREGIRERGHVQAVWIRSFLGSTWNLGAARAARSWG